MDQQYKRVAFYTLGCKVNTFDTQAMSELFEQAGYAVVDFEEIADVYVVNTCTVTHLGDRKSRNMLRRARRNNPGAVIAAAGCYAQVAPETLLNISEVDLVIGTQDRGRIVALVEEYQQFHRKINAVRDNTRCRDYEEMTISYSREHTRAFLKIQEGCDQFCTYCIIPYARGRVRSRSLLSILEEVKRLADQGVMEIVLTGIHIASYGKDLDDQTNLITLVEAIGASVYGGRIRLGSLEPLIITETSAKRLAAVPGFCPHFHLSLQSGSDTVLRRMHRRYTTAQYFEAVETIRRYFDQPAITTDIMVGFPGETDEEFQETMDFAQKVRFYQIHVFKYSRRQGTPAADMADQVDETIKNSRSQQLMALSHDMEQAFLMENDGSIQRVLLEQSAGSGLIEGHTDHYLPVFVRENEKNCGKMVEVALSYSTQTQQMFGDVICRKENAMAEDCLFCKIAAGEIPSEKIYEDDSVYAFKDIDPQAPTHVIIIPKTHYDNILSVAAGDDIIARIHTAANKIALKLGLADEGFRLVTNIGEAGGQSVRHLHYHLLGGRSMQWPPG